ncbi:MAG TPA: hypothetical protein VMP11_13055 [Verrucomicrobiae bacterium]|nr:hypothetical protein [Verrucomicrobiae bacterium]
MSEIDPKQALKNAILEWRKKYNVQDSDPMLAAVELWEIYLTHAQVNMPKEQLPGYEDFRSTLEQCERLGNDFTGRATDVIKELREVPKIRSDLIRFPIFALVFSSALALLAGILIGRFLR